jgi:hypothetical protein
MNEASAVLGWIRERATYANVMSTIAVVLALGGSAYAVGLGRNSVGSKQLKPGAVKLKDTSTSLRLKCPAGTRYHEGACIELAVRSTAAWADAQAACSAAGRRLPDASELLGFAREPGITLGAAQPFEWTSGLDRNPPGLNAIAVLETGGTVSPASDPVGDLHPFRCVANPR